MKEIHHRVKNNLQIVSSLLNLQSSLSDKPEVQAELQDNRDRIKAMALLHETLYASENIGKIDPKVYFKSIVNSLTKSYINSKQSIETSIEVDDDIQDVDMDFAIPCGLIINELVSNSIKYAFPENRGSVSISLGKKGGDSIQLKVKDDGIGLPSNMNYQELDSLGLQIVHLLAEQMNGTIEVDSSNGTEFKIDLKHVKYSTAN